MTNTKVKAIGINENDPAARTLIATAHEFLLSYLQRDDWCDCHHELAAAAAAAVFSASYVDTYYKHELLHAASEKLDRALLDGLPKETTREEAVRLKVARGDRLAIVLSAK
jgi:hypothetical protein